MEVSKPDSSSLSNQKCFPYNAENIGLDCIYRQFDRCVRVNRSISFPYNQPQYLCLFFVTGFGLSLSSDRQFYPFTVLDFPLEAEGLADRSRDCDRVSDFQDLLRDSENRNRGCFVRFVALVVQYPLFRCVWLE